MEKMMTSYGTTTTYTIYTVVTVDRSGHESRWYMRIPWGQDAEYVGRSASLERPDWYDRQPGSSEPPTQVCQVAGPTYAARALTWERGRRVVSVEETPG